MNASKATTGPDIAFEGCLLTVIEDVARCQEEDHCPLAGQVGIRERAGIFGGIDQIPVLGSQLVDGGYSGRYGGMPVGRGPGKDKDADWWWGGRNSRAPRRWCDCRRGPGLRSARGQDDEGARHNQAARFRRQ